MRKKKAYGIGWIDRGLYRKEAIPYNGNEKQLLGNGTYWIQNKASGEVNSCTDHFSGRSEISSFDFESKARRSHMKLIREYDHFISKYKNEKISVNG